VAFHNLEGTILLTKKNMSKNTKIILSLAVVAALIYFVTGREQPPITVTAVDPKIRTVEQTVSNTRAGTIDAC
ncbi:uncharacterized protein METZ01_LOCUS472193, partial [marine metagenome]